MKKIYLGMIIVFVLTCIGCGTTAIQQRYDQSGNPSDSPTTTLPTTPTTVLTITTTTTPATTPITTPTTADNVITPNDVKYYNDENHKIFNFGKLSLDLDPYHIVSEAFNGSDYTIGYMEDQSSSSNDSSAEIIVVREMKNLKLLDRESIKLYLIKMMPSYESIRIYNNIAEDSEIEYMSVISGGCKSYCIANYGDTSYLIDSNINTIEWYIFTSPFHTANYEEIKQNVECANSFSARIHEIIDYDTETVKYEIIQEKSGNKYSAELNDTDDGDSRYNFTLKDDNDKDILNITSAVVELNEAITFLDYNMDGYADIQVVDLVAARDSLCNIYVWDESVNNFVLEESGIEITY